MRARTGRLAGPASSTRRGTTRRGGTRRGSARCAGLALAWALALAAGLGPASLARAAPLDEPFVGGLGFNGPTAANLGAVYWNPAALGLVRGFQVTVGGTMHLARTSVSRTGINAAGLPDPALVPLPTAIAHDLTQPFQWPPGPGSFFAISTDLGGDRFTLAFATYEPFLERVHFTANPDDPTRYHRIDADLRNLALVPALSIRFGSDLRIGVAPGFMFSTGRMSFAEQTAPGGEDPSTDARYDLASGQGLGDARFSVTLGGGIYFRRKTVEFGISYSSRPLGTDVAGVEVAADKTQVTRPIAAGGLITCPSGQADRCVFGDIIYRLPDVWIAGVAWHPRPGAEIAVMARWIWFHLHDRVDVRLTSPALQAAGLPDHIVFHRGFKDVWDARVRAAYWIKERLRLGAALRLETSAVAPADLNPGAVDGFKLEPMIMAELRITRGLSLSAGYGFSYMPAVTAHPSSFDPGAAAACDAAGGDLRNASCQDRQQGRARPTADGRYARTVSDFSASVTARF